MTFNKYKLLARAMFLTNHGKGVKILAIKFIKLQPFF